LSWSNWTDWSAFLAMGGYAYFVWMSYGVTALLLAIEVVHVIRQRRQSLARALVQRKIREWSST
jgi:heme exporter protein D